ncbi:MAG: apolipoprotein N-acyltransferase [Ruminococcaceae bacterium]|nr:apolipoprotein N-acyltransferase [Oscillospiraceae bacterium]
MSRLRKNKTFVLTAVSAFLCALPFTFPSLFILTWVGLAPFFGCLLQDDFFEKNKRTAFGSGFKWGFLYCLFIYYWFLRLYPLDFAGLTPIQAVGVIAVAWLGISAFQALFFGLGTLVFRIIGKKSPLILALIFTLCELMWQFGEFSLPWCKISITQYKFLPAIQSASLFGNLFVSFLIYAVNAFIVCGLKNKRYFAAAAVLFFSNILYGSVMMNIPVNYTQKAEFALIQGNVASSEKWEYNSAKKSFEMFRGLSLEAADSQNPDFIIWPESAVPVAMESYYKKDFLLIPKHTDSIFLTGAFGFEDGKSSNSLFVLDKDGASDTVYHKRHLVPFGEYLPLRGFFEKCLPFVAEINMLSDDLYRGRDSAVMETEFGNIGSLICFDSIFPDLMRESVRDGAQLVVLITNDSWYFDSPAVSQHAAQAVFRSVENRRSIARCANTGISMLIDPHGRIIQSLGALRKGYVSGELGFTDTNTLYTYIGDVLWYAAALYIIILMIRRFLKWKSKPFN